MQACKTRHGDDSQAVMRRCANVSAVVCKSALGTKPRHSSRQVLLKSISLRYDLASQSSAAQEVSKREVCWHSEEFEPVHLLAYIAVVFRVRRRSSGRPRQRRAQALR